MARAVTFREECGSFFVLQFGQREALGIIPISGTVLQKPELEASWFGPHSQPPGVQDGTERDRIRVLSHTSHVTKALALMLQVLLPAVSPGYPEDWECLRGIVSV